MAANNRINVRPDQVFLSTDSRTSGVELGKETAPVGAETPSEGLTEPLGGSAMQKDTNVTKLRRQIIAVEHLEMCARKLTEAKRARIQGVIASRAHGLSCQTIGDALGITEAAVRSLLARHGGDA